MIRGTFAQRHLAQLRSTNAAIILQSCVRGFYARSLFLKLKRAAVLAQSIWKGKVARKQYTEMRIEARKLTNVLAQTVAEKTALEKKFEEIQWKFAAEMKIRQKLEAS